MKRLVIIRHAKTIQYGYDDDYSRELTIRGHSDTKLIANELKTRNILPHKIIASPAKRAITTARVFAKNMAYPESAIEENKTLYFDMTTNDFVEMIQSTEDEKNTVFVVGHNPFMQYIASNMSANFFGEMPTCSTVVLEFDVDQWKNVSTRQGIVKAHLSPRMFK